MYTNTHSLTTELSSILRSFRTRVASGGEPDPTYLRPLSCPQRFWWRKPQSVVFSSLAPKPEPLSPERPLQVVQVVHWPWNLALECTYRRVEDLYATECVFLPRHEYTSVRKCWDLASTTQKKPGHTCHNIKTNCCHLPA